MMKDNNKRAIWDFIENAMKHSYGDRVRIKITNSPKKWGVSPWKTTEPILTGCTGRHYYEKIKLLKPVIIDRKIGRLYISRTKWEIHKKKLLEELEKP